MDQQYGWHDIWLAFIFVSPFIAIIIGIYIAEVIRIYKEQRND